MELLPFLHAVSSFSYFFLAFYIASNDPKSLFNRVCFFLLMCFGIWSFGSIFVHNTSISYSVAITYVHVCSVGWLYFISFLLWATLIFTEKKDILKQKKTYFIIFFIPSLLLYKVWDGSFRVDLQHFSFGWESSWFWGESIWPYLFHVNIIISGIITLSLAFNFIRKTKNVIKKIQGKIIFTSAAITFFICVMVDIILQRLNTPIPTMTPLLSFIWVVPLVYAIIKYNFLSINSDVAENIISTMQDCLFLINQQGLISGVNIQAQNLLGYREDELRGMPFNELFEESTVKSDLFNHFFNGENFKNKNLIMKSIDGKKIPVNLSRSILTYRDGTTGIVCIATDMTENMNKGEALRASEEKYKVVIENMDDGYYEVDLYGNLTFFNEAICRIYGYEGYELLGMNYKQYISEDNLKRVFRVFNEIYRSKESTKTLGYNAIRKDGRRLFLEISVHLIRNSSGKPTGFRGMLRDITERKKFEDALRESEKNYRGLIEELDEAVYRISLPSGKYEYLSPAAEKIFGYKISEFMDNPDLLKKIIHPDFADYYENKWNNLIKGDVSPTFEFKIIDPEGKERWIIQSNKGIFSIAGNIIALEGICRDITDLKRAEEEMLLIKDSAISSSINAVTLADLDGDLTYVNNSFLRMWGYESEGDILGSSIIYLWKAEEKAKEILEELKLMGSWVGELVAKAKDGSEFNVHFSASIITDQNGEPICMTASFVDISMRKEAEDKLRQSDEKYKALYRNALVGMITTDKISGRIIDSNDLGYQIFGYTSKNEFIDEVSIIDKYVKPGLRDEIIKEIEIKGEVFDREIEFRRKDGTNFWAETAIRIDRTKETIESVILDITQRKEAEKQVYQLTFFDPLTELANKEMFKNRLGIEIMKSHRFAVMCIGLDKYKNINDMYGPTVGDRLLKIVATKLKELYFKDDLVSRFEGDKFMAVISDIGDPDDTMNFDIIDMIVQKTRKLFAGTFKVDGNFLDLFSSIGVCLYPNDGNEVEELMKNSESAMYLAKEQGGDTFRYFDANLNNEMMNRLKLEKELRTAISNNEFIVYYQPKVDRKGNIIGIEALIRWKSPQRDDLVLPHEFIPLAEKNGLIVDIGYNVLKLSCEQNMEWQKKGYKPIFISVNLSAYQFSQPDLIENIEKIIKETGLDPNWLELEITESGIMDNEEEGIEKLNEIHNIGISISIDDFGIGYSSLSKLRDYPVDTLKIDKSFIDDLPHDKKSATIATTIIDLAHNLGFKVVAEGVENKDQLDFLNKHNCDQHQGYYFSKPVSPEEIEKKLKKA